MKTLDAMDPTFHSTASASSFSQGLTHSSVPPSNKLEEKSKSSPLRQFSPLARKQPGSSSSSLGASCNTFHSPTLVPIDAQIKDAHAHLEKLQLKSQEALARKKEAKSDYYAAKKLPSEWQRTGEFGVSKQESKKNYIANRDSQNELIGQIESTQNHIQDMGLAMNLEKLLEKTRF